MPVIAETEEYVLLEPDHDVERQVRVGGLAGLRLQQPLLRRQRGPARLTQYW